MITVFFVFGIFSIVLGILLFICRINEGILIIASDIICMTPFLISKWYSELTKQDVIDGKAVYQETQIITGNDTIKTYEIVWKKENF